MKKFATKIIVLLLIFISANVYAQKLSGAVKLIAYEKTNDKEGRRLIVNEIMTVVLNDSIKQTLTTDADGSLSLKNLDPGKYKITLLRKECQASAITGVVIGEGKTAYITLTLICDSYLNSLTKKEKKKLGYN